MESIRDWPIWEVFEVSSSGALTDLVSGLVALALYFTTLTLVVCFLFRVVRFCLLSRRRLVSLSVRPLASEVVSMAATEQFFVSIYGLRRSVGFVRRVLGFAPIVSFEVESTRGEGVRFLVVVEERLTSVVERMISSHLPAAQVERVELPGSRNGDVGGSLGRPYVRLVDFKQVGRVAPGLSREGRDSEGRPLDYLLGLMSSLLEGERVSLQLVSRGVSPRRSRVLSGVAGDVSSVGGAGSVGGGGIGLGVGAGVASPLFEVGLRVQIEAESLVRVREMRRSLVVGVEGFSGSGLLSLRPRLAILRAVRLTDYLLSVYGGWLFRRRMFSDGEGGRMTFGVREMAEIYHFPNSLPGGVRGGRLGHGVDNLSLEYSRSLAAPVSMKSARGVDYVIGRGVHHGVSTLVGLSSRERERHMYILGGTGNGKTTMMLGGIMQDIESGKGLAIVDPHGDLAEEVLGRIPESRLRDVIYFNPDDLAHPVGLNLLELTPGLTGDDLVREKDQVTEMALSVLRKLFSESDIGGHRVEYILRNTIQTALTVPDATLFTIYELLNNPPFRYRTVAKLDDPHLELFWRQEFTKAGDMQRIKMAAGVTSKIGRFLFSSVARRVIGQARSTIDFDSLMDEGKILICNFSKGLIGEDTSVLFGTMVLARLQLASLRRARLPLESRREFYLYVDEFQNFATMSFVQMLSEARKYRLYLVIAEQSTTQQGDKRLVEVLLANVGTVVAFRSGSPADERMILPLFTSFIGQGEIANLPTFHFYSRLAGINPEEPVSGQTILPEGVSSLAVKERVIARSRQEYTGEVIDNVLSSPPPVEVLPGTGRRGSTLRGVEVSAVGSIEVDSASSSGGGGKVVVDEGSIGVVDKPSELVGKKFGIPG